MFENTNPYYILFAFSIIFISGFFADKIKDRLAPSQTDEYKMVQKYLLNDSPLYGHNKPKLWIHTKYEYNARHWESFHSRSSMNVNQPYLHLTIKSIINYCGDEFNICLIDDETFSKLIPSWDIDLKKVEEPMKERIRKQGLMSLLYYYGGMIVPNSFLCMSPLKPLYDETIGKNKVFVCESINRTLNMSLKKNASGFIPNIKFMGSPKNNEEIKNLIEYMKMKNKQNHFTNEPEYLGDIQRYIQIQVDKNTCVLIDGDLIGIKTKNKRKPILIEDLFGDNFIDLATNAYGIYIPEDDILSRIKYQWFSVMTTEEILKNNFILSKYMKSSVVDSLQKKTITSNSIATNVEGSI